MSEYIKSKCYLQDIESLSDLFTESPTGESQYWQGDNVRSTFPYRKNPTIPVVGSYLTVRGECPTSGDHLCHSKTVVPTERTRKFIQQNMLPIESDSIYFQAISREDGILIVAKYNQILGSRNLALVPHSKETAWITN